MFSISLAAVTVLTAFGAIAVLWAQKLHAASRISEDISCNSPSDSWLSKITSQPEKKPPLTVRERLLRLLMIFERTVVNFFSFPAQSSFMQYRRPEKRFENGMRVSLLTAYAYHFGSHSGGSPIFKVIQAMFCTVMGVFSPDRKQLCLALERVRVRDERDRYK